MRKAIIKEVRDLNERELELLLNDKVLRDEIMRYVYDMESLYVDDIFDYIKPYLSNWCIGAFHYNNYIVISDVLGFISGLEDMRKCLNIPLFESIDNLLIKADTLIRNMDNIDDDIHEDIHHQFEDDLIEIVDDLKDGLVDELTGILEYYDSFEKVELESDYIDNYLENIFDSECLIDDNKVTLI